MKNRRNILNHLHSKVENRCRRLYTRICIAYGVMKRTFEDYSFENIFVPYSQQTGVRYIPSKFERSCAVDLRCTKFVLSCRELLVNMYRSKISQTFVFNIQTIEDAYRRAEIIR